MSNKINRAPGGDPAASAQLYMMRHLDEETLIAGIFQPRGRMVSRHAVTHSMAPVCPYCGKPDGDCRCLF